MKENCRDGARLARFLKLNNKQAGESLVYFFHIIRRTPFVTSDRNKQKMKENCRDGARLARFLKLNNKQAGESLVYFFHIIRRTPFVREFNEKQPKNTK